MDVLAACNEGTPLPSHWKESLAGTQRTMDRIALSAVRNDNIEVLSAVLSSDTIHCGYTLLKAAQDKPDVMTVLRLKFDGTQYPSAYDLELACEEGRVNDVVTMRDRCDVHAITDIIYEEDSAFKTACRENRVEILKEFEMEWDLRAFDLHYPMRDDGEWNHTRLHEGNVRCIVGDSSEGLVLAAKNRYFETLQFLYEFTRNDIRPQFAAMVHRVYVELSHPDVIAFMRDRWGGVVRTGMSVRLHAP